MLWKLYCRVKQAFLKADEVLQLTATAQDLLSDSEDRRIEAATKYTNLTDYVMFQIMERTEESLGEVCTFSLADMINLNDRPIICSQSRYGETFKRGSL